MFLRLLFKSFVDAGVRLGHPVSELAFTSAKIIDRWLGCFIDVRNGKPFVLGAKAFFLVVAHAAIFVVILFALFSIAAQVFYRLCLLLLSMIQHL